MVKASPASEAGVMPSPELVAKMGEFNQKLAEAGVLLAVDGLYPSSRGVRIRYDGGKPAVIDGPFAEAKELIGGFWIVAVASREEAIEWFTRCPFENGEEIELRPIFDAEDFAAAMKASRV
jgi:hypothetical protein